MGVIDFPSAGIIGTSLKPKRYDIEVYQGDSFEFNLELSYQTIPTDVTGWVGLCQVRDSADLLIGTAAVSIVGPPANGVIKVNFDSMTNSPEGEYRYDLQMTDAGGKKRTFIGGKLTITVDVSE